MLLLGVVIERVSGKNYFDCIRDNITKPASMANTDSFAMDDSVENLVAGYIADAASQYKWKEIAYYTCCAADVQAVAIPP